MANQRDDIRFGDVNEQRCKSAIEEFLGITLIKNTDPYAVMDFSDEHKTVHVELKSRRIVHDKYETALIGRNKVEWCRKRPVTDECYFAYAYTDGVWIIRYDEERFNVFAGDPVFMRGGRTDVVNRSSDVVYIPINQLRMVSDMLPNEVMLNVIV